MATNTTDDDTRRTVDDPEESAQDARIRGLIQRRREAIDAARTAERLTVAGEAKAEDARQLFLAELRALIMDLWPTLRREFDGAYLGGEYVGDDVDPKAIGTFTVDPPESLPTERNDDRLTPGASPAMPKQIKVDGLAWFVQIEVPIEVRWRVRTMTGGPGWQTEVVQTAPPTWVLNAGLNHCSEFMAEIGIDLEMKAEDYEGGGDPGL
jgi:hypothetical protein